MKDSTITGPDAPEVQAAGKSEHDKGGAMSESEHVTKGDGGGERGGDGIAAKTVLHGVGRAAEIVCMLAVAVVLAIVVETDAQANENAPGGDAVGVVQVGAVGTGVVDQGDQGLDGGECRAAGRGTSAAAGRKSLGDVAAKADCDADGEALPECRVDGEGREIGEISKGHRRTSTFGECVWAVVETAVWMWALISVVDFLRWGHRRRW